MEKNQTYSHPTVINKFFTNSIKLLPLKLIMFYTQAQSRISLPVLLLQELICFASLWFQELFLWEYHNKRHWLSVSHRLIYSELSLKVAFTRSARLETEQLGTSWYQFSGVILDGVERVNWRFPHEADEFPVDNVPQYCRLGNADRKIF